MQLKDWLPFFSVVVVVLGWLLVNSGNGSLHAVTKGSDWPSLEAVVAELALLGHLFQQR